MTILPCTPDSGVSSTGEVKDWSVTTLRTVEVSEIKQLIINIILRKIIVQE